MQDTNNFAGGPPMGYDVPALDPKQAAIQKLVAQLMMQQSQQQNPQQQGALAYPVSPLLNLSKGMNGAMGAYMMSQQPGMPNG